MTLSAQKADETALIERIAGGDSGALRALYDCCATRALAVARRILADSQEAEEVVQETFVQVWRQAERFDAARGSAVAWVATIARSRAIDRLRTRDATERAHLAAHNETQATNVAPATADLAEERERRRRVGAALESLPVEQRRALELAYFEGLSQAQIAARLGDPLGTVKTRVRLGLSRLATLLGDMGVGS